MLRADLSVCASAWSAERTGLIGDCDELAGLVLERYAERRHPDDCDTCAYRIALAGFADKIGQPQTPHHHPDDHGHPHDHEHA